MIYEMSAQKIGARSLQLWLTFRRSEIKHEHLLETFSKICHLRSIYLFLSEENRQGRRYVVVLSENAQVTDATQVTHILCGGSISRARNDIHSRLHPLF
jgi:hypothetical protein